MEQALSTKTRYCWQLAALLYFVLLATITLEHWLWSPPAVDRPWLIWCFRVLPLLIFLPAVVTQYGRGFIWLGFVVLFYFTSGVVSGWVYSSWAGWLLAFESLLLFATTVLFVRWYFQGRKKSAS